MASPDWKKSEEVPGRMVKTTCIENGQEGRAKPPARRFVLQGEIGRFNVVGRLRYCSAANTAGVSYYRQ